MDNKVLIKKVIGIAILVLIISIPFINKKMDRDYEEYKQNFYEELEREKAQKSQSQYSLGSSSSSVGNVQLTSEERSNEQNEILDNNIIDDSVIDNPHNYYNYYELYKTIVNNRRTRNREQKGMYFKFYADYANACNSYGEFLTRQNPEPISLNTDLISYGVNNNIQKFYLLGRNESNELVYQWGVNGHFEDYYDYLFVTKDFKMFKIYRQETGTIEFYRASKIAPEIQSQMK